MARHALRPPGAPDPEAERRFAERAFPLLEPVDWAGERHRGGYGVGTSAETTSLALVFGPPSPFVSVPRLEIAVGSSFPIDLDNEDAPFALRGHLVADADEWMRGPDPHDPTPVRLLTVAEVEGELIEIDTFGFSDRWIALGQWRAFVLFIRAAAMDRRQLKLRLASERLA